MFGVYRYPDLSNKIVDCLLTAMAKVESLDNRKASFLFVGDKIAHHEEWLGCSTTNLHGRAASDFASSSCLSRRLRSLHTFMEGCLI